jgi:ABC-2 type transport system ATP-binding protein
MEEAEELCDRVGIIDHGKLIALGTPKELIVKNHVKNLEEVFIELTGRNMREEL